MPSTIKKLSKALASKDITLPEGLRSRLAAFIDEEIKQTKPSFFVANWDNFWSEHGSKFGPPLTTCDHLTTMCCLPMDNTPAYDLPPLFHTSCALGGWRWMEVYGEKLGQVKEEGTLRLLEPVCLVNLSRLIRLIPGQSVSGSSYCPFSWAHGWYSRTSHDGDRGVDRRQCQARSEFDSWSLGSYITNLIVGILNWRGIFFHHRA